jgi:type 1 fimbria pilin
LDIEKVNNPVQKHVERKSNMKTKLIMWIVTLVTSCLPGISHALNCFQNVSNGPVVVSNALPPNIYVNSTMADGTVLWRSDEITYSVACLGTDKPSETIYFWMNPKRAAAIQGVKVGIIYKGTLATTTASSLSTGYITTGYRANFSLTYSVVLVKSGTMPTSGSVNLNYSVFQLDGVGGINANGGTNLNQYVTGTVNYSGGGTCSLASGDVSKSVSLQQIKPADLPSIGSAAGKKTFTLTVTNCSTGTNTAQFTFQGTPDADNAFAFANTGTAKGVAINLGSSDDGSTIRADGTNNLKIVRIQGGSGVMNLFAQYLATAPIKAGTVNSNVTVNITYQ